MPNDMTPTIEPRSDQWNFDDFQTGPMTFKIVSVRVKGGQEQPVEMTLEGTDKFYRPCKSMARILVNAWGADSAKYSGRSLTLYGDAAVKWGGMAVGGIRISHMSDIDSAMTMALTVTRANKKPFTVKPLKVNATPQASPNREPSLPGAAAVAPDAASRVAGDEAENSPADEVTAKDRTAAPDAERYIDAAQIQLLESTLEQRRLKVRFGGQLAINKIVSVDKIPVAKFEQFMRWIESQGAE